VIVLPMGSCTPGGVGNDGSVARRHSGGGGHTTWAFRTCDQTVYGPPLNKHCTPLEGPATVRISTSHANEAWRAIDGLDPFGTGTQP
jgi:hypothetical protein